MQASVSETGKSYFFCLWEKYIFFYNKKNIEHLYNIITVDSVINRKPLGVIVYNLFTQNTKKKYYYELFPFLKQKMPTRIIFLRENRQ